VESLLFRLNKTVTMRYLKKFGVTTGGDKGTGITFGASPTSATINYTPKILKGDENEL
tara:strand:+ start:1539 stop:1712 length:174 start_codon:yes stop_codon:yes gene_type:complete